VAGCCKYGNELSGTTKCRELCRREYFDFSKRTLLQGAVLTLKSSHSVQIILPDDLDTECGLDAYSMTLSERERERKDVLSADRAVALFPLYVNTHRTNCGAVMFQS
jgi:hypothetical protein